MGLVALVFIAGSFGSDSVEYNTDRPYGALGCLTPEQFALAHQQQRCLTLGSTSVLH